MTILLIMLPMERKHGKQSQDVCSRERLAKKKEEIKQETNKKKTPETKKPCNNMQEVLPYIVVRL